MNLNRSDIYEQADGSLWVALPPHSGLGPRLATARAEGEASGLPEAEGDVWEWAVVERDDATHWRVHPAGDLCWVMPAWTDDALHAMLDDDASAIKVCDAHEVNPGDLLDVVGVIPGVKDKVGRTIGQVRVVGVYPIISRHPFRGLSHADGYVLLLFDGTCQFWQIDGIAGGTVARLAPATPGGVALRVEWVES